MTKSMSTSKQTVEEKLEWRIFKINDNSTRGVMLEQLEWEFAKLNEKIFFFVFYKFIVFVFENTINIELIFIWRLKNFIWQLKLFINIYILHWNEEVMVKLNLIKLNFSYSFD